MVLTKHQFNFGEKAHNFNLIGVDESHSENVRKNGTLYVYMQPLSIRKSYHQNYER